MDAEVRAGNDFTPPAGSSPAAFVLSFWTAISKDPGPGEQDPPARRLAHSLTRRPLLSGYAGPDINHSTLKHRRTP